MMGFLWVLSGIVGAAWISIKLIPAMIDDLTYGDEVDLGTSAIVLMVAVLGIALGAMLGPFLALIYGAMLLLQRVLNSKRQHDSF